MARPRQFDEGEVVAKAALLFSQNGYNATSVDDLLQVTGLQRGSLYKAFGSKLNLFSNCLDSLIHDSSWASTTIGLDFMIVALNEVAPVDQAISKKCKKAISEISSKKAVGLLGSRLIQKAGIG